jgi:hypothetical protein
VIKICLPYSSCSTVQSFIHSIVMSKKQNCIHNVRAEAYELICSRAVNRSIDHVFLANNARTEQSCLKTLMDLRESS